MQTVITKRRITNHQTPEFLKPSAVLYLSVLFLLSLIPPAMFYGFQIEAGKPITLSFITGALASLPILALRFSFKKLILIIQNYVFVRTAIGGLINSISKPVIGLLLIILLFSCNGQPLVGVSTDMNTGMVTTYSKIKPEEA